MRLLESVDCYIDENNMVYEKDETGLPKFGEGKHLKEMSDEWWDKMDPHDLSRIDLNGGLY